MITRHSLSRSSRDCRQPSCSPAKASQFFADILLDLLHASSARNRPQYPFAAIIFYHRGRLQVVFMQTLANRVGPVIRPLNERATAAITPAGDARRLGG